MFKTSMEVACEEQLKGESGIYFIINKINGKTYIGSSYDLHRRFNDHLNKLRKNKHSNLHLQSAFNLYGENQFIFYVVGFCPKEEVLENEQYLLDLFDHDKIYNISFSAGNPGLHRHSEETKRKMSATRTGKKGHPTSQENKEKHSKRIKELWKQGRFKGKTKKFKIVDPNGIIYEGENIREFCRVHSLSYPNIAAILNNQRWQHKGWKKFIQQELKEV